MSVAFAPSGNLVASGGLDNICTVYNVKAASPKTLRELDAHTGEQARYKCFLWKFLQINKKLSSWYTNHTQGTYLAAVSLVILKFWQLLVTLLGEFSHEKRVWMIFFFQSHARINSDMTLSSPLLTSCLWDLETGKQKIIFTNHIGDCMSLALSPDMNTFISGACDSLAKLWDLREGACKQTFTGHTSDINAISVSSTTFCTSQNINTWADKIILKKFCQLKQFMSTCCYLIHRHNSTGI